MKRISSQDNWCESWKSSYQYDLLEIYEQAGSLGYTYAYKNRYKHTLKLIEEVSEPGTRILDVAAAQGNFTLALAELGYEITWNDLREELVDYVKLKWEYGVVHYAPGNVFDLDFDRLFDIVLITEVIEHVAHPNQFLQKISELVKPGGYIVMSTPNGEYFRNRLPRFSDCLDPSQFEEIQFQPNADGHIFLLHLDEVNLLAQQAGLAVIETRLFGNSLTNGHLKLGSLLKILPRNWIHAGETLMQSMPLRLQRKLLIGMAVLLQKPF